MMMLPVADRDIDDTTITDDTHNDDTDNLSNAPKGNGIEAKGS